MVSAYQMWHKGGQQVNLGPPKVIACCDRKVPHHSLLHMELQSCRLVRVTHADPCSPLKVLTVGMRASELDHEALGDGLA